MILRTLARPILIQMVASFPPPLGRAGVGSLLFASFPPPLGRVGVGSLLVVYFKLLFLPAIAVDG